MHLRSESSPRAWWQSTLNLFIAHPASVGESYFAHQRTALKFSGRLLFAAVAAAIHAVFPCLCTHTARDRISALNAELESRSGTRTEAPLADG